jgi:hypothetical protein
MAALLENGRLCCVQRPYLLSAELISRKFLQNEYHPECVNYEAFVLKLQYFENYIHKK